MNIFYPIIANHVIIANDAISFRILSLPIVVYRDGRTRFLFVFVFDFPFLFIHESNGIANPRGPCGAVRCDRFFSRAFVFYTNPCVCFTNRGSISGYPPERLASLVALENPAKILDRCSNSTNFENSSKTRLFI